MATVNTHVRIERSGDDLILRIPIEFGDRSGLKADDVVRLQVHDREIHLSVETIPHYDLEQLLDGVTPEQFHPAVDTGGPVGKEIW
jgi:antitoxin MazE